MLQRHYLGTVCYNFSTKRTGVILFWTKAFTQLLKQDNYYGLAEI